MGILFLFAVSISGHIERPWESSNEHHCLKIFISPLPNVSLPCSLHSILGHVGRVEASAGAIPVGFSLLEFISVKKTFC